jgi:hypothetical protein
VDGPFFESKYEVPYHTTGHNMPEVRVPVDITIGTNIPSPITMLTKTDNGKYFAVKRKHHGVARAKLSSHWRWKYL